MVLKFAFLEDTLVLVIDADWKVNGLRKYTEDHLGKSADFPKYDGKLARLW
eukprot:CAMPEP_0206209020 /NCGR_PEP_ID=MMETSP0166-20121206/16642_1 /ASSEMBLY_ACC=CAM_ASM_000260 /TAXON_ID=95228 /ORGANISM="Vannella robusta, Strain DIVA3 518/3/11/1/6" /LENGTH=50 /DNA_ID=CAMNT_0053630301 /DNA_START=428 /DNA_END=577 /DNA_ORIENTATION=-